MGKGFYMGQNSSFDYNSYGAIRGMSLKEKYTEIPNSKGITQFHHMPDGFVCNFESEKEEFYVIRPSVFFFRDTSNYNMCLEDLKKSSSTFPFIKNKINNVGKGFLGSYFYTFFGNSHTCLNVLEHSDLENYKYFIIDFKTRDVYEVKIPDPIKKTYRRCLVLGNNELGSSFRERLLWVCKDENTIKIYKENSTSAFMSSDIKESMVEKLRGKNIVSYKGIAFGPLDLKIHNNFRYYVSHRLSTFLKTPLPISPTDFSAEEYVETDFRDDSLDVKWGSNNYIGGFWRWPELQKNNIGFIHESNSYSLYVYNNRDNIFDISQNWRSGRASDIESLRKFFEKTCPCAELVSVCIYDGTNNEEEEYRTKYRFPVGAVINTGGGQYFRPFLEISPNKGTYIPIVTRVGDEKSRLFFINNKLLFINAQGQKENDPSIYKWTSLYYTHDPVQNNSIATS